MVELFYCSLSAVGSELPEHKTYYVILSQYHNCFTSKVDVWDGLTQRINYTLFILKFKQIND